MRSVYRDARAVFAVVVTHPVSVSVRTTFFVVLTMIQNRAAIVYYEYIACERVTAHTRRICQRHTVVGQVELDDISYDVG